MSSSTAPSPAAQPGWYADPGNPQLVRYWDGYNWTDWTMPAGGPGGGHGPESNEASTSNIFSAISIIAGLLAVLIAPIILGPIGLLLAAVGYYRRETWATIGLVCSISGTIAGILIGAALLAAGA